MTQGAQFVAIDNQPAATTSLVLSATPLLVAVISTRALAEPPSGRQVVGGLLVVSGATTYFAGALGATVVGMAASLVGLTANAVAAILGRGVNRAGSVAAVVVTALSMTIGACALGVASLMVEGWPTVSSRAAAIIGWLAIVNTAFAFTWWNVSLRRLSAIASAGINNTMLVQIAALAWVFLGEPLGWGGAVGVGLVSIGVFLIQTEGGVRAHRYSSARWRSRDMDSTY